MTWTAASVPAGPRGQPLTDTIVFTVTVEPDAPAGLLTNTVAIASQTEDDNPDNNTFTQTATVSVLADVAITKSHGPNRWWPARC